MHLKCITKCVMCVRCKALSLAAEMISLKKKTDLKLHAIFKTEVSS